MTHLSQPRDSNTPDPIARIPSETFEEAPQDRGSKYTDPTGEDESSQGPKDAEPSTPNAPNAPNAPVNEKEPKTRKPARGAEPFEKWERDEMEKLLGELCGHLGMLLLLHGDLIDAYVCCSVVYPNRFLEGEDIANNFLFNADR